jgi:hypothetical protein
MARMSSANVLALSCAAALVAGAAACNRTADREARGHVGAPINVTGCLQKGDGMHTFVLTQVNEPTQSVGTTGTTANPGTIAREQMREAKHAFELDGDNDELSKLVGKQVSVEGTIKEASDLNKRAEEARKDNKAPDLGAGDLAKVDVKTIAAVSDTCSDHR